MVPSLSSISFGCIVSRTNVTHDNYGNSSLVLIQALIHMIIYCSMGSEPNRLMKAMQWITIAVVWARKIELNLEIQSFEEEVFGERYRESWEYLESRRRTW